ncbi:unnamed protein product [Calypogeia fissa]
MARYGVAPMQPAKATVAIDFGTTYSGFSYAYRDVLAEESMSVVQCFEQWPSQDRSQVPYCKTQTSLLYVLQRNANYRPGVTFELKAWGWTAFHEHRKLLQDSPLEDGKAFHFIKNFKLALVGSKDRNPSSPALLPEGFTAQRVVSDYLRQMSLLIGKELQENYGRQTIGKKDIQWCLTVPAIWDNAAKEEMRRCAEIAGLVNGPLNVYAEASPHPVIIVLEPEAASVYCLRACNTDLPSGSKILVVDAGGGTVDLTFHEKMNSDLSGGGAYQVKEISASSGALCGAKFVDDAFFRFLTSKISCFNDFMRETPAAVSRIHHSWDGIKVSFDGSPGPYEIPLPAPLSRYWQKYDRAHGMKSIPESNYDEIRISLEEMKGIFDTVLHQILELIEDQLTEIEPADVRSVTIMVVGGFSASPYLMDRIRKRFKGRVKYIINPTQPGKAVVKGALLCGRHGREMVTSRISRMTYGIVYMREFHRNDPESNLFFTEDGRAMFKDAFHIYARKGDSIPVDYHQKIPYVVSVRDIDSIKLEVYTSSHSDPAFVTDPGTMKECTFTFPIPPRQVMAEVPIIEVSMYFGRATIEVTAMGLNFRSERAILPTLTFEPRRSRALEDDMAELTVVDTMEVASKSYYDHMPYELKALKAEERLAVKEMSLLVDGLKGDVGPSSVQDIRPEDMVHVFSELMRNVHTIFHQNQAILQQNEVTHHQVRALEMLTVAMGRSSVPRLPYLLQRRCFPVKKTLEGG